MIPAKFPILPIGTYVRSYDFAGVDNCYVEGTVVQYGGGVFPSDSHYCVKVERRVFDGKEKPVSVQEQHVYPPFNGMFGRQLVFEQARPVEVK